MGRFSYARWVAPAILVIYLIVSVAFWTHRLRHPAAPAPASAPAQK